MILNSMHVPIRTVSDIPGEKKKSKNEMGSEGEKDTKT